jgi:hypothetical protein
MFLVELARSPVAQPPDARSAGDSRPPPSQQGVAAAVTETANFDLGARTRPDEVLWLPDANFFDTMFCQAKSCSLWGAQDPYVPFYSEAA